MQIPNINTKSGFTPEEMKELSEPANDEAVEAEPEVEETEEDAAPEPQPAAKAQVEPAQAQQKGAKPPPGFVPKEALDEVRVQAREARDKAARMEQTFQELQRRIAQQAQPQPKEPQFPDINTDPAGHILAKQQYLESELAKIRGQASEREQAAQQEARTNEMLQRYASHVSQYTKQAPDFNEAYAYLAQAREKELELAGYSDPVDRTNRLQYEEGLLVGRAMMTGQDPAHMLYELAKFRGYAKSAPEPKPAANDNKLATIAKGQKAAKSLGNGSGAANANEVMTLEALTALADEDPDEFDKQFERMKRKGLLG